MRRIIISGLLFTILTAISCTPAQTFDGRLKATVEAYTFSIARWEFETALQGAGGYVQGEPITGDNGTAVVWQYFSSRGRIRDLRLQIEAAGVCSGQDDASSLEAELDSLEQQAAAWEGVVEQVIGRQIREVLAEEGIFNPLVNRPGSRISFPPISFKLEPPPHLLVISPRERIERLREVTLRQNISLEEMEYIEANVDQLGVSSLVAELGGFGGTYPSSVSNNAGLQTTIDTATEEWLHQYLVFKPLGFRYLLYVTGLSRDHDIATMNETLAGMVSEEIGSMVYERYYGPYMDDSEQRLAAESEFDREMKEIRRVVDEYLVRGEVEQAEEFMEQGRQNLVSKGYYIRKLNQAYFALHGIYGDSPSSVSPIGPELERLRSQFASLRDFLNEVTAMTSYQDLKSAVK